MLNIFSKILDLNAREVDRLKKIVEKINSFEAKTKMSIDIRVANKKPKRGRSLFKKCWKRFIQL